MKVLTIFATLVGVAAALPEPVAELETPAHATLVSILVKMLREAGGTDTVPDGRTREGAASVGIPLLDFPW